MKSNSYKGATKNHFLQQLSIKKKIRDLSNPISVSITCPNLLLKKQGLVPSSTGLYQKDKPIKQNSKKLYMYQERGSTPEFCKIQNALWKEPPEMEWDINSSGNLCARETKTNIKRMSGSNIAKNLRIFEDQLKAKHTN